MSKAPVLKINDKEYTMAEPKARTWRELTKLKEEPETTETWVKIVAKAFSNHNITEDDIWDNVGISDLMPLSFQCISYVNELINEKLDSVLSKNVGAAQ